MPLKANYIFYLFKLKNIKYGICGYCHACKNQQTSIREVNVEEGVLIFLEHMVYSTEIHQLTHPRLHSQCVEDLGFVSRSVASEILID